MASTLAPKLLKISQMVRVTNQMLYQLSYASLLFHPIIPVYRLAWNDVKSQNDGSI